MKLTILPSSGLGRTTLLFGIIFFILAMLIRIIAILQGVYADQDFFSNPLAGSVKIAAVIAAVAGFITGSISIAWKRERSVLVFLITLAGLLVIVFQD